MNSLLLHDHFLSLDIKDGILSTVGGTPLVRLRRFIPGARFDLFAKLEAINTPI
jgi:cysteine synthase